MDGYGPNVPRRRKIISNFVVTSKIYTIYNYFESFTHKKLLLLLFVYKRRITWTVAAGYRLADALGFWEVNFLYSVELFPLFSSINNNPISL
jgi:hypothetical protein